MSRLASLPFSATWAQKVVRVALDADACRNRTVGEAIQRLVGRLLKVSGLAVELETWDEADGKGIDDLLANGAKPAVIQGERVSIVAQRIADTARAANPPAGGPGGEASTNGQTTGPSALVLIRQHLLDYYRPTFRRGPNLYSDALGREIARAEACYAPTPQLVDDLEMAADCPRGRAAPSAPPSPGYIGPGASVAWRGVLDRAARGGSDGRGRRRGAEDELRAAIWQHMLGRVVSLGHVVRDEEGDDYTEVQARSLLDWCHLWADRGSWESIRSYWLWCRLDGGEELPKPLAGASDEEKAVRLQLIAGESGADAYVALRVELAGQVGVRVLADWSQHRLTDLCEHYGLGGHSPHRP